MNGINWLLIGTGAGVFYGVTLWGSVAALQPTHPQRSLLLVLGSALVRCLTVAAVLGLAARGGWRPCLLAWTGFLLTRLAFMGTIGLRQTQE